MEKYSILLGYFDKQMLFINKIRKEIVSVNVSVYEEQFVFAMRTQQFYTAIEDLLKQIAKSFENHIDQLSQFHKELLIRMNTEIPSIRPAVLTKESLALLDKIRSFRHFIRHAYDCELDDRELKTLQDRIIDEYPFIDRDLASFRSYVLSLTR